MKQYTLLILSLPLSTLLFNIWYDKMGSTHKATLLHSLVQCLSCLS